MSKQHKHTAGYVRSPTYLTWDSMISRCDCPSNASYKYYGAVGIYVCTRWHDFRNFLEDMGERPEDKTLDRRDVNGNYTPDNCKWSTRKEQQRNRSNTIFLTLNGFTKSLSQWAEELGIHRATLHSRLRKGLPDEEVLKEVS